MKLKLKRIDPFLIGSGLLAGFLNIFNIWKDQYANAYYTAAVTSMLQSFHNFFFASFDPGGFVTVDKPPVAFWVQTLFAYIFGVHGWSVVLPQALAGVGSVLLIYFLVKPTFGRSAARIAALAMACTPIAVAVSRTNNVDSLLVFTLLLGTWMLFRAVKTSKPVWFISAFAMIGVAFNVKMLQAFMVLPAFYLFYWLAYKVNWKKKLGVLAASTVVMLVLSFSWALIVDSIPQADRPYIGSSQTNSVLELAFGYNGLARLTGQGGPGGGNRGDFGDGQIPGGQQADFSQANGGQSSQESLNQGQNGDGISQTSNAFVPPQGNGFNQDDGTWPGPGDDGNTRNGSMGAGGPGGQQGIGGMFHTGTPGVLRLFQSELSGQISWLLPFALLSAVGLLLGIRRKRPLTGKQKETMFWLAWLLPMMGFFSVAEFFHQYYLIMLAPALAALSGAGWVELSGFHRNGEGWKRWLLPAGIMGTTVFQFYILWPYRSQNGLVWPVAIGIAGSVLSVYLFLSSLIGRQVISGVSSLKGKLIRSASVAGLLVLLATPLYWAATPLLYGDNAMMPAAGPQTTGGFGGMPGGMQGQMPGQMPGRGPGEMQDNVDSKLLVYLEANNTGEKFLFATSNAGTAETYIIKTGKAVMAMGGFSGSDPILTVDKLKQMVEKKEIKYFLVSDGGPGGGPGGGNSAVLTWIKQNGKEIPQSEWQSASNANSAGGRGMFGSGTLYEVTQ